MAVLESEINQLKQTTIKLFQQAFLVHQRLGEDGKLPQRTNSFGESTLTADWEAEEVIINGCQLAGIPTVFSSEEHGEFSLVDNPKYRGIIDGIDGTNAFKMGTGSYGTMFAIFEGVNPKYRDYLVSGILEYPSGRILIATRGNGAFIHEGNKAYPAITSGEASLNSNSTRIFIDGGFEINKNLYQNYFGNFENTYLGNVDNLGVPWGVSSIYYFKLATGETDVVLECTRKRNLEIAIAFGILNEGGAVMVDDNGESIANRRYLEFGQGQNEFIPVISASSLSLAQHVAKYLKT